MNTLVNRLREKIAEVKAEALLVTQPANVRYLSGFTSPADARVLVTEDKVLLITDGRYIHQAKEESRLETLITTAQETWLDKVAELAKPYSLAIESDHLSVEYFNGLKEKIGREPLATKGLVNSFRLIKTPQELALIRDAAHIADQAFSYIINFITPGVTEIEVALELERYIRKHGAESAFEIIVASGVRSSMPHGHASTKPIATGELVTLDFGAKLEGYHSDMTRTIGVGEVPDEQQEMYAALLSVQEAALNAIATDQDGKAIDAMVRENLKQHKLDTYFTHGLGHGVGLDIHEGPRMSPRESEILKAGMTVTVEPGVYIPGKYGARIEDLVVVTESGCERLSTSTKVFLSVN
jgi:Xaa-Pro aminopeptidase